MKFTQFASPGYLALIGLLALINFGQANAMAGSGKKCMFSGVQGVVTLNGTPVEGATVLRNYLWEGPDKSVDDNASTDAMGRFSFDARFDGTFLSSIFPHNPSINQRITITYERKQYKAWVYHKNNYDLNGELGGKPLVLKCELSHEASQKDGYYGLCELE